MISALAALALLAPAEPISLVPTDDIWIYEHASDQTSDEFLRTWGGPSGPIGEYMGEFSISCLKFKLPEGIDASKLESAKLVLFSIPEVAWTAEDSKAAPLQARRVEGDFVEDKWDFTRASQVVAKAGEAEVYGFGSGAPGDAKPFTIEVDLLKGKASFKEALKGKDVKIALTTPMDPQDASGSMYKVYSRNASDEALRPRLVLKFAD